MLNPEHCYQLSYTPEDQSIGVGSKVLGSGSIIYLYASMSNKAVDKKKE
jgi:hypothetical protein